MFLAVTFSCFQPSCYFFYLIYLDQVAHSYIIVPVKAYAAFEILIYFTRVVLEVRCKNALLTFSPALNLSSHLFK